MSSEGTFLEYVGEGSKGLGPERWGAESHCRDWDPEPPGEALGGLSAIGPALSLCHSVWAHAHRKWGQLSPGPHGWPDFHPRSLLATSPGEGTQASVPLCPMSSWAEQVASLQA